MPQKEELSLVTGAGGFVGGHLVRLLVDRGVPVRAMVRDPKRAGELEELGGPVVVADLRDEASLEAAARGVTKVYHIASLFRQAGLPERVFHDVNAEGTRRLLDASIRAGAKRFVHCSTVGVLGHVAQPPADENSPYNPGDMYQRSKLEGERVAMAYFASGRISGVVIRPAMIYGPGDTRNLKMWKMIAKGYWFYVGDGQTRVHFVDVRDLARAFLLAMENEALNAEVYIVAGQRAVTQQYMAECIARELGVKKPWLHLPVKPMQWLGTLCEWVCTPLRLSPPIYRRRVDFFTKHREFNGAKAEKELLYRSSKSFEEEVAEITCWYRAKGYV